MSDHQVWSRRRVSAGALVLVAMGCARPPKQAPVQHPAETLDDALDRLSHDLRRHVADKARRERAQARLDELRPVLAQFDRLTQQWRNDSRRAFNEGAGPDALLEIADRNNLELRKQLERGVQIGFGLRADILEAEWRALFPAPERSTS